MGGRLSRTKPVIPTFTLNNGNRVPSIAFGVGTKWKHHGDDTLDKELLGAIEVAIEQGFRHFDAAEYYNTEKELGIAIKNKISDRKEVFITTKLQPGSGTDVKPHLERSLEKLGLDYIDLYLIHNPFADSDVASIWKELEKVVESGKVKAIGVSNFSVEKLNEILSVADIKPAVNQIEFHPYLQNQSPNILEFSKKHDILVTAFGPLTPIVAAKGKGPLDAVLEKLAEKYSVTTGQILLRWTYQYGVLPITTTSKPERARQALDTFGFELEKSDFDLISDTGAQYKYRGFYNDYFD